MLSAKRLIIVVGTQKYLLSFPHNTIFIVARITGRLASAPAHRLQFLQLVRDLHQALTARKQTVLKIRTQTVTDDRNVQEIYDIRKIVDLCFGIHGLVMEYESDDL